MDYISEILKDKHHLDIINNIASDYIFKDMRYSDQTDYLRFITVNQLNLPKNTKKGKLELCSFEQLFELLIEEIHELKEELEKDEIDKYRVLSEIGDVSAFLTGFIAKIIEMKT